MRTVAALAALFCCAIAAHAAEVSILLSDSGPAYVEAAHAAELQLSPLANTARVSVDSFERGNRPSAIVLTLGTRAFRAALASGSHSPIVAALIPRAAYELELKSAQRPAMPAVTAVFLDQPVSRQLDLVHILLPSKKHVGVLVSPASKKMLRALETAANQRGLALVHQQVSDPQQISRALSHVLETSDVLLAVPDPLIYNAGTIHNILLSALRLRQPLIGFSEAYVRAGALAAVYTQPEQAGRQAAEIAARSLAGVALPAPQDPQKFTVRINEVLARSLGLAVEPEAAIAESMLRMERAR